MELQLHESLKKSTHIYEAVALHALISLLKKNLFSFNSLNRGVNKPEVSRALLTIMYTLRYSFAMSSSGAET